MPDGVRGAGRGLCLHAPGFSGLLPYAETCPCQGGTAGFALFLCTILDASGRPAKEREYCERQGEKLRRSFRSCLRRGDIYTRYSDDQYLLLCIGAGRENVAEIGARLDMDFRKRSGGRGGVICSLLDDGNIW